MAFLFPKLFPNCVTTGGFNVSLSLENAMAMYWKPMAFQFVASCTEDGDSFSINTTLQLSEATGYTLSELICSDGRLFFSSSNAFAYMDFSGAAYSNEELYVPSFSMEAGLTGSGGFGRNFICRSDFYDEPSGFISFNGQSLGATFFNDDTLAPLSGSGSLTIIAERTFE
jgi:hypothetical protein